MNNQNKDANVLVDLVLVWGLEKGITGENGKATLLSQLSKTQEELDETVRAAEANDQAGIIDGIGDCAVTLILAAERAGVDFRECLHAAYNEIKGRKGKMVDGLFVKEI